MSRGEDYGLRIKAIFYLIKQIHINIDEYEQREAKNTKSSLTLQQYCLQKKKKKLTHNFDNHT